MKVIYVSGPYRAPTEYEVGQNIRAAEEAAIKLWQEGWAVICPHKNTARLGGVVPDGVWIKGDIAMLIRCDAIYMLPTWERSEGARAEHEAAVKAGIPAIYAR